MGLDIYIYELLKPIDLIYPIEVEYKNLESELWEASGAGQKGVNVVKEEQAYYKRMKQIAERMNIEDEEVKDSRRIIDIPSEKYPDHYWKIGYFRSSYNSGGINSVCRDNNIPDMYSVFDMTDNFGNYFLPNWEECLKRAEIWLEQLKGIKKLHINYIQCAEIMIETIEFVLDNDGVNYCMYWSG